MEKQRCWRWTRGAESKHQVKVVFAEEIERTNPSKEAGQFMAENKNSN